MSTRRRPKLLTSEFKDADGQTLYALREVAKRRGVEYITVFQGVKRGHLMAEWYHLPGVVRPTLFVTQAELERYEGT